MNPQDFTIRELEALVADLSNDDLLDALNAEQAGDPRKGALKLFTEALEGRYRKMGPKAADAGVPLSEVTSHKTVGRCAEHGTLLWDGLLSGNEDALFCPDGGEGGHYVPLADAKREYA